MADVADARQRISATLAGGATAGTFSIVLFSPSPGTDSGPATASVPESLRETVRRNNLAVQYALVPQSGESGQLVKGLMVGEPVQARSGLFELYYLFPLTAEDQTIQLIQRTVLLAGLALVVLVLGIVLLVTRQVVLPVRVAAETAGRLAAGDLSKRIKVRGSDDIARLGQSFNDMADRLQRQIRRLEDLSRVQRRFTSDVSHELRTPLTTIRMAAEYLHGNRSEFPAGTVAGGRAAAHRAGPVRIAARRPARDLPLRRRGGESGVRNGRHPRRGGRRRSTPVRPSRSGTAARSSCTLLTSR